LALIARATSLAPERADLAWLHVQLCSEVTPCDVEPLERHLRDVDPSNGAGWLGTLSRAQAAKNEEAEHNALAQLARADHFDIYWTRLIARLVPAAATTQTMPLPDTEASVIGFLAARAIPAFRAVSEACKGERLQRPEDLEVCRGVARTFERGDSYISEMMGRSLARRLWPEGSPEWNAAVEARRVFEYRTQLSTKLDAPTLDESGAERFLVLCAQNRREQDVLVDRLRDAGQNPDPPAR